MSKHLSPHTLIIGGTAAYGLDLSPYQPVGDPIILETPYGHSPTITFLQPDASSPPIAFCSRHGVDQLARSAAFVNHRALIWAARMLGVNAIFSWNGVGAIAGNLEVGDQIIPHDLIDFTNTRVTTFDNTDLVAATGPAFHPAARASLLATTEIFEVSERSIVYPNGVYVCTEGPRLETVSEIALYHSAGADIVGMTLTPEIWLAQEVDIAYASLGYVTNYATGRAGDRPLKRDFGPNVAHACLPLLLSASHHWITHENNVDSGAEENR